MTYISVCEHTRKKPPKNNYLYLGIFKMTHWPSSRVQTRPKLSDFSGQKIFSTPSFGGEVKAVLSHVADLQHVKEP
jgi:hypothetical protein